MHNSPVGHITFISIPATFLLLLGCLVTIIPTNLYAAPSEPFTGSIASTSIKPELIPLGVHQFGFTVFPDITYTGIYDDNVLASDTDQQSGYTSVISPSIIAQSNWNVHELVAKAQTDIGHNHKFSSEDYKDLQLSIDGIIDIKRDSHVQLGINKERKHIERTAPNTANGLNPTKYTINSGYALFFKEMGKFTGKLQLESSNKNYDDVDAIRANTRVRLNQDDRDRTDNTLTLKGTYVIRPNYKLTAQLLKNFREYVHLTDNSGNDRSSQGHGLDLGLMYRYGNWIFGDIHLGYRQQDYKKPFPDIHATLIGGSINWNITTLTSIIFESQRSIREGSGSNFSGYISTNHALTLEHELRRHIVLTTSIDNIDYTYRGIGTAEREESLAEYLLGVTYIANRNFNISMNYSHLRKEVFDSTSNAFTSGDADKNIYTIKAQIAL